MSRARNDLPLLSAPQNNVAHPAPVRFAHRVGPSAKNGRVQTATQDPAVVATARSAGQVG